MNPLRNNNKIAAWILHGAAWLTYSGFVFITKRIADPHMTFLRAFLLVAPFCITFYLNIFCLRIYRSKGTFWGLISSVILFLTTLMNGYCYIFILLPSFQIVLYSQSDYRHFLENIILGYVQYSVYSMLYFGEKENRRVENNLRRLKEEKSRVEKHRIQQGLENALLKQQKLESQREKLQYEYAFLRTQISPHFLYNTLNALFSQALNFSQELADNILKLSGIMRYSLESVEFESGKVSIQKELEQLQILLDIYNLRFNDSKIIQYTTEGSFSGQMVPPLAIITVVENAFKYGDLKDPSNPLLIKIRLRQGEIYFYCRNRKNKNNVQLSSLNIGLSNLKSRLDATFKDMYEMSTCNEDDFYTFELTIKNDPND